MFGGTPSSSVTSHSADSSHLSALNPEQYEAVTYGQGPLLVFAGAGSGKTRVLTRRIAHLIIEQRIHPEQIFAVTFTNKAAKEMKSRIGTLFSGNVSQLWVSTFHSAAVRLLRKHAPELGYRNDFAIYDSADSLSTLKRVYQRLKLDPDLIDPKSIAWRIDRAKNDYLSPDDLRKDPSMPSTVAHTVADVFTAYQEELLNSNAMDFGDLLVNIVTLLRFSERLRSHYQEHFRFLLVDEYQDTNRVQYLLLKMLSEKYRNITVVGDDDQSIYAFRGATISNILNFKSDFPEAHTITLAENYRSTKNILTTASRVIAHNKNRQEKSLRTANPEGNLIVGFKAYDEQEEGEFVVQEILGLIRDGMSLSDIAIFYRTNAQSRAIEEALVEVGMPYEIYGGHRFYDRKEIKDILAYYRLLLNPDDNESLLRVINTPARGIGPTTVEKIAAYAAKQKVTLLSALEDLVREDNKTLGTARKKLAPFIELLRDLRTDVEIARKKLSLIKEGQYSRENGDAIATLLLQIANKSNYLPQLKEQATEESIGRSENIYELFNVAVEFVRSTVESGFVPGLQDFLDRASLASDLDREEETEDSSQKKPGYRGAVRLMTLHLAKGLEFDAVFLVGLEEGLLPHSRSVFQAAELEEERRLLYVGITRARKQLFLSRAEIRSMFRSGSWGGGVPSRFIAELPEEAIEDRRGNFLVTGYYD